jgi:hypothetical protein
MSEYGLFSMILASIVPLPGIDMLKSRNEEDGS